MQQCIQELFYDTEFVKYDASFLVRCFGGFPAVGQFPATSYDTAVAKHMAPCVSRQELVELRMASNERIVSTLWSSDHDEELLAETEGGS